MGVNIVKLEDVCEFYRGLTYSKKDEASSSNNIVLRANNIDLNTSTLDFDDLKYLREDFVIPEDKKLQKDCIFICMSSGSKSHLGKVAFIDRNYDYAFGGFMGMIKPKTNVLPRYLFYLLQTPEYKELLRKLSNGININNIKFSDLKDFEFDLPTLDEQEKIVSILDKADEIRTKKRLANDKLDEFLKSTFISMFGDPVRNEKGIRKVSIDSIKANEKNAIVDGPFGSSLKNEDYFESGVPIIRINNIRPCKFYNAEFKYIKESKYEQLIRSKVNYGDVLMARVGNTIGKSCLYDQSKKALLSTTGVCKITCDNTKIINKFLLLQMNMDTYKAYIVRQVKGAGQPCLNLTTIKNFDIILPTLEQQKKYVQIVEKVEEQKQKNKQVIEQMDNLFNSLSQRAFKGEL